MNNIIPELSKFSAENKKNKPSSTLSSLWIKIEKHQKRNANFTKKRSKLFEQFKQQAQPAEQKLADAITAQVEHLIRFLSKKSLTDKQRNELLGWVSDDIDYLATHLFSEGIDVADLREQINTELTLLTESLDQAVDEESIVELANMLDEMFDGEMQFNREELIEIIKNPALIQEHVQRFHEKMNEEEIEKDDYSEEFDQGFEEDFDYQYNRSFSKRNSKEELGILEKLFKGSQLNKMYKRLAAKLHPDKESDATKKAIKHDLMQQLASARENKDVFTLLTLYHEHIDDDSFNFDAETLAAIEALLSKKVSELNAELKALKSADTPEAIVWEHFHGRSNKITTENIVIHAERLEDEVMSINQFIVSTSTLKALKTELNTRIKQRESSPFFNFDDDLESMLGVPF
ncbi:hypothetical protein [Colwellia polaris]|jgi:hypothetical protein|uniref:hypothetical protein n=1 Tax=Colwellia polaris TaxID=326537 RepID=UPI000A16FE7A|nr:hypothetical protein [Colwellia polaris]